MEKGPLLPLLSCELSVAVKESPDGKKKKTKKQNKTKQILLYIPLIIIITLLKKVIKTYKVVFVDSILIIAFSESINIFRGASLQNFCIQSTVLFQLTG